MAYQPIRFRDLPGNTDGRSFPPRTACPTRPQRYAVHGLRSRFELRKGIRLDSYESVFAGSCLKRLSRCPSRWSVPKKRFDRSGLIPNPVLRTHRISSSIALNHDEVTECAPYCTQFMVRPQFLHSTHGLPRGGVVRSTEKVRPPISTCGPGMRAEDMPAPTP